MWKETTYSNQKLYIPKASGCKEYAYEEEINYGYRDDMEDGYFFFDNILGDGQSSLFGLMDGHGGKLVRDFVANNFCKEFLLEFKKTKDVKKCLENTFMNVDDLIKKANIGFDQGCTAVVGFIRLEESKKVLYVANVGDSRAVLFQDTSFKRVSVDHRPSDAAEAERVRKMGGSVMYNRVSGLLAVSRAFGDFALKDKGVTAMPDVARIELRKIDRYLVIASDGLWDVLAEQTAFDIIKTISLGAANDIASELIKRALKMDSRDNVSVLVLRLVQSKMLFKI
eukprot:TRINITY_DN1693_c0_g2_i1.p1 TRINITY_DN1693_c0_g2~~TRINITY_DN1693_c0_g2_i1.p1  ORF type:complete len:282 (-),score=32.44 TRINITY_DN1693_c0_g2_i1:194-1039(-)